MALSVDSLLGFFGNLFKALIGASNDIDSARKVASTLSTASKIARNRYRQALQARPPAQGAGGGFTSKGGGGSGDRVIPPRVPGSPPSGGSPLTPPKYTDGIDYQVRSSWIAAWNFRTLHNGKGGMVSQYSGSRFPSTMPANKGDLTMVTIRASYANPSGRYVYPNIPRIIMDRAADAPSPGRFYWKVLRYYSNRSLIGRRMRRTSRRLSSS